MKCFLYTLPLFIVGLLNAQDLNGAWVNQTENSNILILIQDNYFTRTVYTPAEFEETIGGTYKIEDNQITVALEFDTASEDLRELNLNFELKDDVLVIDYLKFNRLGDGNAPLAGVWRISGRMQGDKLVEIHQRGTRKTLKLLTATHFQWFAIDPGKNEFYGTGGGTYSFENGKYTENIEFFSRDNSRVGAALSFDDRIEDDKWIHTGLSSKGDPIHEVWEKID